MSACQASIRRAIIIKNEHKEFDLLMMEEKQSATSWNQSNP